MTTRVAEVVIIGGGVIGASIAWHLAQRGCTDVLLLDQNNDAGAGSTSKATGGFRAQFASAINIRLSLLSRQKLLRFEEEVGADSGYRQHGYLFIASDDHALRLLAEAQTLQHSLGLAEARMIDADEVRRINRAVTFDRVQGAAFCPTDGFIRAMQILNGYLERARKHGVRTSFGESVVGFRLQTTDGRQTITSVITGQGEISSSIVVNAAGAWAATVARMAGVALPVAPLRRQVAITQPTDVLPETMPMTIFAEDGFHARVRDGRVLLLLPDGPQTADPFDASVEDAWIAAVRRRAAERMKPLAGVEIDRPACWAGLYEMSPDHHAIVGRSPEVENFFLANGSSGHGVMHSPALGQIVAEMILDGTSSMDVHALRPERFAEGELNEAPVLL